MPSVKGGFTKKQRHGNIHNKDKLGDVVEMPLEEAVEEPPPKSPLPEHRLPYSLHMESKYSDGHHLKEDSKNQNFIRQKVMHALERFEDFINRVDVHLDVNDKFHHDNTLAPYVFQVLATLKNREVIRISNPEKHARPTLQEALDHTLDVTRKSLKEHREKKMHQAKRARKNAMPDEDLSEQELLDADALAEELAMADDAEVNLLYSLVEDDLEGLGQATATTVADAVARSKPITGSKTASQDSPDDLRKVLMAGL